LFLKLFFLDGFLGAVRVFLLGAVVVRVVCETAARELFRLFLGGNERSAFTATYRPPKRDVSVYLRAWIAFASEEELNAVILITRH
jgi:hypothetical protein